MRDKNKLVKCNETSSCFGKKNGMCQILIEEYQAGTCPFRKPKRNVTNGKIYRG